MADWSDIPADAPVILAGHSINDEAETDQEYGRAWQQVHGNVGLCACGRYGVYSQACEHCGRGIDQGPEPAVEGEVYIKVGNCGHEWGWNGESGEIRVYGTGEGCSVIPTALFMATLIGWIGLKLAGVA